MTQLQMLYYNSKGNLRQQILRDKVDGGRGGTLSGVWAHVVQPQKVIMINGQIVLIIFYIPLHLKKLFKYCFNEEKV